MIKAEFSASLRQSSVSHDPSEIILIYWFMINVETVVLLNIFFGTCNTFFFDSSMNEKLKRTAFIQNKNIKNKSLLSLFIHPCWIKVLISLKKNYWLQTFE